MKHITVAMSLMFILSALSLARDATELKNDLLSMLPDGKTEIRMAWLKSEGGSSSSINIVSSEDGAITPLQGTGSYSAPHVAANGQRVFFMNLASDQLCAINWDGTGFEEIDIGGYAYEYWCNPDDGSDWAVVGTNGTSRVKIDAPGTKVQISYIENGGDGCGLSEDGNWLLGYYDGAEAVAFSMCNTSTFEWTYGPHGGCVGSLSGGAEPKYNHNPSGHTMFCIHDALNQEQFTMYATTDSIQQNLERWGQKLADCYEGNSGGNHSQEATRFAQSPDFLTCTSSGSRVNPILVRIPDMKMIYIEDNLSCMQCWEADAVFLPYSPVAVRDKPQTSSTAFIQRTSASNETYSLDGRRLGPGFRAVKSGVVVHRINGKAIGIRALVF